MMTCTKKTAITCYWKGYNDRWWITKKARWSALKMLLWYVTKKAMMMADGSLKRVWWQYMLSFYWITYVITTPVLESIKALDEEEKYDTYTHRPHTVGSKELEPWSPRWVRQKLREKNNGLSSNDPNHNEKPPANTERPVCKCNFNCQSHMSLDHDTYGRSLATKGSFSSNIYISYS
jgi:hypothetical protein